MFGRQEETEQERLIALLTEKGDGSFLRGWRRFLDPDGSLDINFEEFCVATQTLGFHGDVRAIFGSSGTWKKQLTLEDLSPEMGSLMIRFREFVHERFGGPVEMYSAFDVTGRGRLNEEMFVGGCKRAGFEASDFELHEVYCCADVSADGSLSQVEVTFLEPDNSLRELAKIKAKKSQRDKHMKIMCWAYREDGLLNLSPTHRRSQRPWLGHFFVEQPILIHDRRVAWQRVNHRKHLEARIEFIRHLRNTYVLEVRAWRAGLDPHGAFQLNSTEIKNYCRKHDLHIDCSDLWKSLDKDCDGYFRLEELDVDAADVLASFQHWAHETFGSCAAIWDRQEMVTARALRDGSWASQKKLLTTTFAEMMKALGWPAYDDVEDRNTLLTSLDLYGCGFISRSDLEWLDKWRMPEWLFAEPDWQAWEELRARIMHEYKHPLRAWRQLLDTDNSNCVSWLEFKEACERVRFKGNLGGAWRALNVDLGSSISMKEYDPESADLLNSFKDLAETNYGSVKLAFKAIDVNNMGRLDYRELRRACQNLKWEGEVKLLFDCLECDGKTEAGKRYIGLKDLEFLDAWQVDAGEGEQKEEDIVNAALARPPSRARSSSRPQSRASTAPSRTPMGASSSLPSLRGSKRPNSNAGKVAGVPPSTAGDTTTSPCTIGPARTDLSSQGKAKEKERLHRTYHLLRAARQPRHRARPKSSLPWLRKILMDDDLEQGSTA